MSREYLKRSRGKEAASRKVRWPGLRILKQLREGRSLTIKQVLDALSFKYSDRSYRRTEAGQQRPERDRLLEILIFGFAKKDLPPIDVMTINKILAVKPFPFDQLSSEEIKKYKLVDDTMLSEQSVSNTMVIGKGETQDAIEVHFGGFERRIVSGENYFESNFYIRPPEGLPTGLIQFTLVVRIFPVHWEERMRRGSFPWEVGQPWVGFCDSTYWAVRSVLSPITLGGSAQPHMIISTFDGYSLRLYINGAPVKSDQSTSRAEPFDNGQRLAIGMKYVGNNPHTIGWVSDVLIYDRPFFEPWVREVSDAFHTVVGCQLDATYIEPNLQISHFPPANPSSFRIVHRAEPALPAEARFPPARI